VENLWRFCFCVRTGDSGLLDGGDCAYAGWTSLLSRSAATRTADEGLDAVCSLEESPCEVEAVRRFNLDSISAHLDSGPVVATRARAGGPEEKRRSESIDS
jgi:hypothetical protein